MTASRVLILRTPAVVPGAGVNIIPAVDQALLNRADLVSWHDARRATLNGSGVLTSWASRKQATDGTDRLFTPPAEPPTLITTTDGQSGLEFGKGVVGANKGRLIGGTNLVLPPAPWTVAYVGRQDVGLAGVLWATNDPTTQITLATTTANGMIVYPDYASLTGAPTGAAANDGLPHLWSASYDGTTLVLRKDGTQIATSTVALPAYPSRVLRVGAVNHSGSDISNHGEGYVEHLMVFSAVSADIRAAVRAVVLQRHPGWTIAA